ncbi:hypothetical protein DFJ73DRAFT_567218 [Zopfochytrium polystomum]|nr:hypothetical protein DFJ73DRAFT_567218 [Zopfochytrium polystomum]
MPPPPPRVPSLPLAMVALASRWSSSAPPLGSNDKPDTGGTEPTPPCARQNSDMSVSPFDFATALQSRTCLGTHPPTMSSNARQVVHTVMWKARPTITPELTQSCIKAAKTLEEIEGVISSNLGESFTTDRSQGFTHQLVVVMKNRDVLAHYAPHPLHVAARDNFFRIAFQSEHLIAMDIEI